jgi:hypothetical protein
LSFREHVFGVKFEDCVVVVNIPGLYISVSLFIPTNTRTAHCANPLYFVLFQLTHEPLIVRTLSILFEPQAPRPDYILVSQCLVIFGLSERLFIAFQCISQTMCWHHQKFKIRNVFFLISMQRLVKIN